MQYLHLVYLSDRMMKGMHRDERCCDTSALRHAALQGLRRRAPCYSAGSYDGTRLVTDGPFVETKECRVSC